MFKDLLKPFILLLLICSYIIQAKGQTVATADQKASTAFDSTKVDTYPALPLAAPTKPDFIICNGTSVKLKGNTAADPTYIYEWSKKQISTGNTEVVKSVQGDNTYTEATTNAGYYEYQLRVINPNSCASEITTYRVYVMPELSVKKTADPTICADNNNNTTASDKETSTLSVNLPYADKLKYTYVWKRDGTVITGSTGPTHTIVNEATSGDFTYTVDISYDAGYAIIPSNCSITATFTVHVDVVPNKPSITPNY